MEFFDAFMLCSHNGINPLTQPTLIPHWIYLLSWYYIGKVNAKQTFRYRMQLSSRHFPSQNIKSSTLSHIQSICYNCNGPLLWKPWPFRSSNLIGQHLVKFGHFCSALVGQNCLLISLSKNMTECTKHGRKKHEKTSSINWPDIIFVIFSPHKSKAKTA